MPLRPRPSRGTWVALLERMNPFAPFLRPVSLGLIIVLSGIPGIAAASLPGTGSGMISTREAVGKLSRSATVERIRTYIARPEVVTEMVKHGLNPSEVSTRLASMSPSELRQISESVTRAEAGGEVIVIGLTTVLLVVIILLLMNRI